MARRAPPTVLGWAEGLPSHEIAARAGLSRQRALYWLRSFRTRRLAIFREEPAAPAASAGQDGPSGAAPAGQVTPAAPAQSNDVDPEAQAAATLPKVKRTKGRKAAKRAAKAAAAQAAAAGEESAQAAATQASAPEAPGDNARAFEAPTSRAPDGVAGARGADAASSRAPAVPAEAGASPEPPAETETQPAEQKPEAPKISADEPMSEAGRKILYTHFCRMVENEEGTRSGEDPEALHDMRVATRRMRAAFQLFEPYFAHKALAPFGETAEVDRACARRRA